MRTGELVRGRCKATNLCEYCRALYYVETTEALWLDATEHVAPSMLLVLTTRTATADPAPFYRGRELLLRALRRRWPDCQYACLVEFTTGKGTRSGGSRRPHWNLLLKGIPDDDVDLVRDLVARVWCAHVDAEPAGQYAELIRDAGGLGQYLGDHFTVAAKGQEPPTGWRGQRFNASRGYFGPWSRAEARDAARHSLRLKRELYRLKREGVPAEESVQLAHAALEVSESKAWDLVDVFAEPVAWGPDGHPTATRLTVAQLVADRGSL